jgi:predicted alpha/beta hydrolase family esterase
MKKIFAIIIAASLTACASVDVTKTSKGFYEPTDANNVEILKTVPKRPYEELGTVTVTGFSASDTAKMHNAVRAKSAALGATAVILTEEGIINDGWGMKRWATGVAIAFKE